MTSVASRELAGLRQAVLPGGGVDDEQHLGDPARLAVGHPPDLAQLLHEVRLGVEAAGGVAEHEVVVAGPRPAATASKITALGSPPSLPRTKSAPARSAHVPSCSAAAARNVSPAAITTLRPSATCCAPTLPIVVVLPTPLTPTNSHTFGEPSGPVGEVQLAVEPGQLVLHVRLAALEQLVRLGDLLAPSPGPAGRRAASSVTPTPTSARSSASSSSSQVSSSMPARPRTPTRAPVSAARALASRSRKRGRSSTTTPPASSSLVLLELRLEHAHVVDHVDGGFGLRLLDGGRTLRSSTEGRRRGGVVPPHRACG